MKGKEKERLLMEKDLFSTMVVDWRKEEIASFVELKANSVSICFLALTLHHRFC